MARLRSPRALVAALLMLPLVAAATAVLPPSPPPGSAKTRLPPVRLTPAPAVDPASPAAAAYRQGIERLAANDTDGAQAAFRRALELQPGYADALLGLAEVASRKKRPDEAARLIREAVKADPRSAHAYASLGRLQAVGRQFGEAEASLKKAMELDPRLVRPKMDLADLYATVLRRPRDALALYEAVLGLDPRHAGAYYAAGLVHEGLGEPDEAQKALQAAARLEPNNPLPAMALARLRVRAKDLDGAQQWADRAVAAAPAMPEALELRGDVRQGRGDTEGSLADYAAALRTRPGDVALLLKQGSVLQQAGRAGEAAKSYQEAIKADPRAAVAYNNLAWMAAESRTNLEQAERWARKAIELAPNAADFHDTLGWVQRARGNPKAAEKTLLHAASLKGAPASTFYHLGVVQRELGRSKEAAAAFERAVALDSGHKDAAAALQEIGGRP
jgi:tetratricopeptide (TPR) repeat protein